MRIYLECYSSNFSSSLLFFVSSHRSEKKTTKWFKRTLQPQSINKSIDYNTRSTVKSLSQYTECYCCCRFKSGTIKWSFVRVPPVVFFAQSMYTARDGMRYTHGCEFVCVWLMLFLSTPFPLRFKLEVHIQTILLNRISLELAQSRGHSDHAKLVTVCARTLCFTSHWVCAHRHTHTHTR